MKKSIIATLVGIAALGGATVGGGVYADNKLKQEYYFQNNPDADKRMKITLDKFDMGLTSGKASWKADITPDLCHQDTKFSIRGEDIITRGLNGYTIQSKVYLIGEDNKEIFNLNLKEIENKKIEEARESRRIERENNQKIREEAEKKNKEKTPSSSTDSNLCSGDSCTGTANFDPNDLTKPSNLTVSELTQTITKYAEGRDPRVKNFIPLAPAFIKAEKDYGVNAIGIMSIDAHESGWASEKLARLCNNLGGYRGKGSRPCSVSNHEGGFSGYNSKEEFIDKQASKLKTNYLTPGGKFYNGKGLRGISQKYLTGGKDHWVNNISKIGTTMAKIAKEVTGR